VVLVGATDGVGTKLKVAFECDDHRGVGVDLVAMCVNDLIVCGAEPLFFLDYFATGRLSVGTAATVVESIARGCLQAQCGLVGGETAEMPGMYAAGEYDLGGFAVGAVRKRDLLPNAWRAGMQVACGDVLLALRSSGVHANGFALVRDLVARAGLAWQAPAPFATEPAGQTLGAALLVPTKIYVAAMLPLLQRGGLVKALAHITGGGLPENLPRVLPADVAAEVDLASVSPLPPVFKWLQQQSNLPPHELTKTFNCGVGMVVVVAAAQAAEVQGLLAAHGEAARVIGRLVPRATGNAPQVVLLGELQ
jgi:phosphoribosylformylglycinamidine cyclo-ligase